jgi:mono/diheme cytochrome c family protein
MTLKDLVPVFGILLAALGYASGAFAVGGSENQGNTPAPNAGNAAGEKPSGGGGGTQDAAKAGEKLFDGAGCGWCHSDGGRAAGKGPKLAGTSRDDHFIEYRIKHGKEGAMPSFGGQFNDQQIGELIAYIRSLKP